MNLIHYWWVAVQSNQTISQVLTSWDAGWLILAATEGWPTDHDLDSGQQSTWAWPPLAALVVRFISTLTSLNVGLVLIFLSFTGGLLSSYLIYAILKPTIGNTKALIGSLLWVMMPASPVFLLAYSEGPFIALVFGSVLLLGRQKYILASLILIPAGLVKLQVIPFAAAVVVVTLIWWWKSQRGAREVVVVTSVILCAAISVLSWPVFVAVTFGEPTAYAQVQAAWGHSSFPFVGSYDWIHWILESPNRATIFSLILMITAIVSAIVVLRYKQVPIGIRVVGILIPIFFLATAGGNSMARYLLPDLAVPTALTLLTRSRLVLFFVAFTLVITQVLWIQIFVAAPPGSLAP